MTGTPTYILGISAHYHDSAAALLRDGDIVAAAQEERFTRNGNALNYQVTVFDPDTLLEPFKMEPRTLRLNPDAKATLIEDLPCEERDTDHIVTHERG